MTFFRFGGKFINTYVKFIQDSLVVKIGSSFDWVIQKIKRISLSLKHCVETECS